MNLFGLTIGRTKAVVPPMSVANMPGLVLETVRSPTWYGSLFEAFTGQWQRNIRVDDQRSLLAFSAVYACISRIANDVSILRPMLMDINSGIWTEVTDGSPLLPVLRKPNRYQTRIQFLLYWLTGKLMYGNAYILKDRDNRGVVTGLYPLDPRRVQVLVGSDGSVYYDLSADNLTGVDLQKTVPASEIIHDRMNTLWHPLVGVSPLYAAGSSATQGNRIQNNSEVFFSNMSRPSGHLAAPGNIPPEQEARLKAQFESGYSATNLGRLLVTSGGMKYEPMTIPAQEAQLIEQLKWTTEDVARAFHMPLYMIQAGQQPTHSNIGALKQDYLDQTLQGHIEAIELLLGEALGLPTNRGIELETETLLRMDPKSRAETSEILIRSAVIAPNEARFRENFGPVSGGASPMAQQQNYSLAALAKRDAKPDPFATEKPAPAPAPIAANDDEAAAEREARMLIETIQKGLSDALV